MSPPPMLSVFFLLHVHVAAMVSVAKTAFGLGLYIQGGPKMVHYFIRFNSIKY